MAKVGGARPGAGRKPGTPNKRTVELLDAITASGLLPVEYMLNVMRDENADPKDRAWAAEKSAPYVHPKPQPYQRTIEIDLPSIATASDIPAAIGAVCKAATTGEITPAEAQSLSNVIENQRKAIETGEILDRIEALEAQHETARSR